MNYDSQRHEWDAMSDDERAAALRRAKIALREISPTMALVVEELQCIAYQRGFHDGQNAMLIHEPGGEA